MTALEYMEKQVQIHRLNHIHAVDRDAPEEVLENIRLKIGYYTQAVEALRMENILLNESEIDFDYAAEDDL